MTTPDPRGIGQHMMNEKTLCAALVRTIRQEMSSAVVFKHADRVTSGVPDISVTWGGRTVWLEVKYVKAGKKISDEQGIQRRTLDQLSRNGRCFYVIYRELPNRNTTMIEARLYDGPHYAVAGFNHMHVVTALREMK